jgi:hypothetical protein
MFTGEMFQKNAYISHKMLFSMNARFLDLHEAEGLKLNREMLKLNPYPLIHEGSGSLLLPKNACAKLIGPCFFHQILYHATFVKSLEFPIKIYVRHF